MSVVVPALAKTAAPQRQRDVLVPQVALEQLATGQWRDMPHPCMGRNSLLTAPEITYKTLATTLTVIAMMMTLKKKDITLCSVTRRLMPLDETTTSYVWQHMLSTMEKYRKSK